MCQNVKDAGKLKLSDHTVLLYADGRIVYTITASLLNNNYWSDLSLANEFKKYNCNQLLEYYCNNVLICKYTKNEYDYMQQMLKLKEEIDR